MRSTARAVLSIPLLISVTLIAACNKEPDAPAPPPMEQTESAATPVEPAPTQAPQQPTQTETFALATADLDAYQKGLTRENEVLTAAIDKIQAAQSDEEKMNAILEVMPQKVHSQGAEGSGIDEARYEQVKARIGDILGAIEMKAAMQKQYQDMDTTGLDPETAAQIQANADQMLASLGDPFKDVPAEVAQTITDRQNELATLRAQNIGLLFKAASQ